MNELQKLIQRIRKLKTFLLIPHNIEDYLPSIDSYSMNKDTLNEGTLTHLIFDQWIKTYGSPYHAKFCALDKMLITAFFKEKNKPENRNKNPDTDYLKALFLDTNSDLDKTLPTRPNSLNADPANQSLTATEVINNKPSSNIDDINQLLFDGPIKDLFEQYPDIQDFFKKNIDDIEIINFAWEIAKIDVRKSLRKLILKEHKFYYPEQKKNASVEEKLAVIEKNKALINNQNINLVNSKKRKIDEQDDYILPKPIEIEKSSIEGKTKAEKIGKQKTFYNYNNTLFKFKKRKIDHSKSDTIKETQFTKLNRSK